MVRSRIRIPGHFSTSLTVAEWDILRDLSAFLIQSPADFHDTRRHDWRRQGQAIHEVPTEAETFGESGTEYDMIDYYGSLLYDSMVLFLCCNLL